MICHIAEYSSFWRMRGDDVVEERERERENRVYIHIRVVAETACDVH